MVEEQWVPIEGYEGFYEVSDCGNVRSLDRVVLRTDGKPYTFRGRLITICTSSKGYGHIGLSRDCVTRNYDVHVLVARAFLGPRPTGWQVCHNDGNPLNNHISNLRYDTAAGNCADRKLHGRDASSRTHCRRGHAFNDANTIYVKKTGSRQCRSCVAALAARSRGICDDVQAYSDRRYECLMTRGHRKMLTGFKRDRK